MFASILGRHLWVRTTNQVDRFTSALLEVRLQHRVRRNLQESHTVGTFVGNDLVDRSSEQDRTTNVIPAVVDVEVSVQPPSVCRRHYARKRYLGSLTQRRRCNPFLEQFFLWLHERCVESACDTKFGGEDFGVGVIRKFDDGVDMFMGSSNGDSLRRVDASNPQSRDRLGLRKHLADHRLSLLYTDAESYHGTIAVCTGHGGCTGDCDANCHLAIIVPRGVTHSNLTDTVPWSAMTSRTNGIPHL